MLAFTILYLRFVGDKRHLTSSSNQMFIKPEQREAEQKKVRTMKTYSYIAEIEHELEDVLLNTILNHEVFVRNIPLNIEITVSKKIKSEIESNNKEVNVKLLFDPDITDDGEDREKVIQNSKEKREVLQSPDKKDLEKNKRIVSLTAQDILKQKPIFKEKETMHDTHASEASIHNSPDNINGKKKFTLEQDKEILDKVVILLPGKSLANFELSEDELDFLSDKLARSPSSIHQRWKYSLRAWLVQFFSKNHRSWSKNLTVKASVERRKQVVKYFNKLAKKNTLQIEVMNATKIK